MTRKEISAILASAGLRPQHHFGQNFMVDQDVLAAIVLAGQVQPDDLILEVGPGVGNLTRLLSCAAEKGAVLAVDIDRKLLPAARAHHAALANVTWLHADVLAGKHQVEPEVIAALKLLHTAHPDGRLKLVSNLPYNAASPLIAELLVEMWRDPGLPFARMAFTVQWEVALRMAAAPNSRDYGPLGILIQSMAEVEIVRKISAGAFWPRPKIQSALMVVTPQRDRMAGIPDAPALQAFLAGLFSHRRQTLSNALKHALGDGWHAELKRTFSAAGFDLMLRPENLSIQEMLKLHALVRQHASAQPPALAGRRRRGYDDPDERGSLPTRNP